MRVSNSESLGLSLKVAAPPVVFFIYFTRGGLDGDFGNSARQSVRRRMDPRVRDLYKRVITVGRDYPTGLSHVREKAKCEFFKQANLHDGLEINRAINYGRYMVREMTGIIQFKKYRALKQRYEDES